MILGTKEDRKLILKILSLAFIENPSTLFVLKRGKKERRIKDLIDYSFNIGIHKGNIFISDDHKACAIVIDSQKKIHWFIQIKLQVRLIWNVIGLRRLPKVLKKEKIIHEHHPKIPHLHLWYIGVSTEYQHNGIGTSLLNEITDYFPKKRPIVLETSIDENINFYKKNGFKHHKSLQINSHKVHLLSNI
ncbi:GNAT family N-acetyltransferase [Halosquirtibacter xylanolyticus]|uniref:GNAT family N-acetyltransferase n=1 Tax=Halosquirtibacter xylanolyticus TaxID=3374599 RepID=UPI00374A33E6|nr:GNAT family N-acetyltransferase [Prolixibacteraceae bacterium]